METGCNMEFDNELLDESSPLCQGHAILIVIGRDAWSRELTEQWLTEHLPVPIAGLHMRGDDDHRSNATIKREIHRTLAQGYDIRAAIEDEPKIVWRVTPSSIPSAAEWSDTDNSTVRWHCSHSGGAVGRTHCHLCA